MSIDPNAEASAYWNEQWDKWLQQAKARVAYLEGLNNPTFERELVTLRELLKEADQL